MRSIFIVSIYEGLMLDCLYYGYKKENVICNYQEVKQGDILEITNQGKFIIGIGWYILILVNNKEKVYVSITELEHAMETKKIQSMIELELEQYRLTFQLDNALDSRNKELFLKVSQKYNKLVSLKEKSNKNLYLAKS